MKSAILHGIFDLRLIEVPMPTVTSRSVLLKVNACGICPTDINKYNTIYGGQLSLPQNMGHEYVGTVVSVGDSIENFEVGSRIIGTGFGGYAEYALINIDEYPRIHGSHPITVPDSVDDLEAIFTEPLACCVHAIDDQLQAKAGETILVIGAGTMGLLLMMVAKTRGCKVVVSEPHPTRRSNALSFGADLVLDPQVDLLPLMLKSTYGSFVDGTIVTIGNPSLPQIALECTRNCGRVLLFGRFPSGSKVEIDGNEIYRNEKRLIGSHVNVGDPIYTNTSELFWKALRLIESKTLNLKPLISSCFSIEQIHEAFAAAASLSTYKVVVLPTHIDS